MIEHTDSIDDVSPHVLVPMTIPGMYINGKWVGPDPALIERWEVTGEDHPFFLKRQAQ